MLHKLLQNRFLGTASFLLAPRDPPDGGGAAQDDANANDTNDDGGDASAQAGQDAGDAGDDAGGDDTDDAEGNVDGADDDDDADDEDPDLADLTPEAKAKAKVAIAKAVAKETGWRDRQLGKLHAKVRTAQEDVEAAGAIVSGRASGEPPAPENLTQKQIEERARALAKNMTAQEKYDNDSNECDAKGRGAYGDKWAPALAKLPKLGGVDITDMQDILATDQPHVVLVQLSDPDTYERVMGLPPARRRNEFVKLSLKEAPKPKSARAESKRPGDAPPPVRPVGNSRRVAATQVDLHDDKVDDDKWYAERNRTRRKKFSEAM